MKVDVHILRIPGESDEFFQYCLESLEREPVNVHVLNGIEGHVGLGRQAGLQVGNEPYVAYVDPDDMVCRGAFQACIDALEAKPKKAVAYTGEAKVSEAGILMSDMPRKLYEPFMGHPDEALRAHHLCVYRRSMLPDLTFLANFPFFAEQALKTRIWDRNFEYVDRIGYQWRQRKGMSSRKKWPMSPEMIDIAGRQARLWKKLV